MAVLTTPTAGFVLIAATAASVYSFTASARYLGERLEQMATESVVVRPGATRNYSVAGIANLAPGSISAIAPLPKSGPSVAPPKAAVETAALETVSAPAVQTTRPQFRVNISGLNVRSAPSNKGRKVGVVRGGQELAVLAEKHGWVRIQTPGVSGWVHTKYLVAME
jgi:uncharacterized protein YgiM (DUF1202 family)